MRILLRSYICVILFIISLTYSCQKNPHNPAPPTIDPLQEKVTASINGRVVDENGKPVNNANVLAAGTSITTDINGFFRFSNIQLAKNAGFVVVEKTGYLKGSRTIFTNAGVVNNVEIQLIPKTNRGNFTASAGGNIIIQNGSSVNFPASGIINSITNATYTGTVNVMGAYLDPTDPKLPLIMPGNLTGLTTNNEQKVLQTFGMMVVELEGGGGEKLNLAAGKTATITMPIPASLQASAPSTIPLWYFDETKGLWKEEGSATRQGNNYAGTVTHFSFWNCDVPNNFVNLKLKLQDQNSQAVAGYRVDLKNTQNNSIASAITDSTGGASGAVPANVTIEMKVYNKCNTVVHTQNIGPFNAATDMGTITITTPVSANIIISGTVSNCNLTSVTSGFVDVNLDGAYYRTSITNGNYSITIIRCNNTAATAQITATDLQTNEQSTAKSLNVTSGTFSSGNIIACGTTLTQYINFTANSSTINFIPPGDSLTAYRDTSTRIGGYPIVFDQATSRVINIEFGGTTAPGVYSLNNFFIRKGTANEYIKSGAINVTITEYGAVGQFIAGNFTGNVTAASGVTSATCTFRVRRNL